MKSEPEWKKVLLPTVTFIIMLLAWWVIIRVFDISPLILPPPNEVGFALVQNGPRLLAHAGITLGEAMAGFILGGVSGLGLGLLVFFFPSIKIAIMPYIIGFKAIPLVALAPLIVVWFGTGIFSKIILAAIISFFPIFISFMQGIEGVNREILDYMASISATRKQILQKVLLPYSLPALFSGMKVASTFAVIGAVVAEFIGSQEGIGYIIKSSSYYLNTGVTFAAIFVSAGIGMLIFWLIVILERAIIFWKADN